MKKILYAAALLAFINHASAQNSNPWPATGDVGIGTANPASALHVKIASAVAGFSNITVENSGATGNEAGINFKAGYTTTSLNSARIYSLFDGGTGSANARLTLQSLVSNGVYDNTLTVRNGNVGIGTTIPAFGLGSGLEIERLGPATLRLQNTTDSKSMELRQTSTDFNLFNINGQNTILSQNGGNVGVGTTTPGLKTHINGVTGFPATTGTAQTGVLRLQGLSNNAVLDFGVNGILGAYLQSTNQTALNSNYPLLLNPNGGNVSIGTTTPATISLLQVQKNIDGVTLGSFVNTDPGINAKSAITVGSTVSTGGTFGSFEYLGAGRTVTGLLAADRTMLRGNGPGGLMLTAENVEGNIAFATGGTSGSNVRMQISSNGNVGIGTTAPENPLQVSTKFAANASGVVYWGNNITAANPSNRGLLSWDIGKVLIGSPDAATDVAFVTAGNTERMRILSGGNIGIGTTDTKGYKLAVNGSVIATAVTVKLYTDWADYVFNDDYKLLSLTEVKKYIDKNHHLPDMPSAAQVQKDGLNLGEINTALTRKVEELTLYLIEKNEQLNKQQKEIDLLKEQFKLFLNADKKQTPNK